jgi:DNA-binding MarR family transcriptional regulator
MHTSLSLIKRQAPSKALPLRMDPTLRPTSDTASKQDHRDEWLRLDQQLCFALYAASLAMTKRYKPLLDPLGLTYPQYLVLLVLWEQDDRSVNELGDLLHLDSGTLTPLLKRMEAATLLSRRRDTVDERRVKVTLTPQGQALKLQARHIPHELACQMALPTPELSALRQELHALRARLVSPPAKD